VAVWGAVACAVLGLAACGDDDDASEEAVVSLADTSLGEVLVDAEGMTLYVFTNDAAGVPTCEGQCADNWPAALVDGAVTAGDGLDAAAFSTVPALAGGAQLAVGGQPLYTFAADTTAGDVNGQGVGDVWFAVQADGTPVSPAGATGTTAAPVSSGDGGY
jgi:predicted lipoprotein with Yx(FWY)xxD motif